MEAIFNTENFKAMLAAGFVASPNNIWEQPGVAVYAGSSGIPTWKDSGLKADIQVTADSVYVFKPRFENGRFMELERLATFASAAEFLAYVAAVGTPSEPGLPAFSNSWD